MSIDRRVLPLVLVLTWAAATARAEVLVRWDLDQVPARESLGIMTLVVPASKPAVVEQAIGKAFRVLLDVDAASLPPPAALPEAVIGFVVRGDATAQQLAELRGRLRAPGARVLHVEDRGLWPHVRLNWVSMQNNVLQVTSRTAQPWVESNAVFARAAESAGGAPPVLAYAWEPITLADEDQGPATEDYLVAIAEAGSFGADLVLPLHEGFQRDLIHGKPAARARWQEMRRYLEFYGWDLPRQYRRISNIGVITASPAESIEVLRLLTRHNLPFELLPASAVRGDRLKAFAMVVALDPLEASALAPLAAFVSGGGTLVLNEPARQPRWDGATRVLEDERHVIDRLGDGRVVTLREPILNPDEFAKDVREMLGPGRRIVDVWNGITVLIAPYEDPGDGTVLVTALNYAHVEQPVQVRVRGTFAYGYYESPESAPALLPLRHREGDTEFVVPALRVGGRVFLSDRR